MCCGVCRWLCWTSWSQWRVCRTSCWGSWWQERGQSWRRRRISSSSSLHRTKSMYASNLRMPWHVTYAHLDFKSVVTVKCNTITIVWKAIELHSDHSQDVRQAMYSNSLLCMPKVTTHRTARRYVQPLIKPWAMCYKKILLKNSWGRDCLWKSNKFDEESSYPSF